MMPAFAIHTLPQNGGRSGDRSDDDRFERLAESVRMETLASGRLGAVLVAPGEHGTPLVRTTSRFDNAAQTFPEVYANLAAEIAELIDSPLLFNNALVERYDNDYFRMGYHSDLALDLVCPSSIAIFSCYRSVGARPRKLAIVDKESGEKTEVHLKDHSVVVFSTAVNRSHRHKIVLDKSSPPPEDEWLGVTFRTSKTFVQFGTDGPRLAPAATGEPAPLLRLATDEDAREFFGLRKRENQEPDFVYPALDYTLSESDLLPPAVGAGFS